MAGPVQYEVRNKVAVITLDSPPVNSLSAAVRQGIADNLQRARDAGCSGIVLTGANGAFCAGAEIKEFSAPMKKAASLLDVLDLLDSSHVPVVAAIPGVALGGGLEVVLACHFRVATPNARAGLPEIDLGLLPGAGGTQRLPRLIGGAAALQLMLTGGMLSAQDCIKSGIFDAIENDVVGAAIALALRQTGQDLSKRRVSGMTAKMDPAAIDQVITSSKKLRRGQNAAECIITCVHAACTMSFEAGMQIEQREFRALMGTPQANAMQHMFFADRQCAKVPGLSAQPKRITSVGIIGAGLMGGGIAMVCADAGLAVILLDTSGAAIERGMKTVRANYDRSVKGGRRSQASVDQALGRITTTLDYSLFSSVDMIIEAVFENLQIKKDIFARLDKICKPGAVLCTNTSALSIKAIAQSTQRPQDVIGAHFFSPANVMRLLEVVKSDLSSQQTIATAMAFGKTVKKVTVLAGDCPGFIGNRMLGQYTKAADALVEDGVPPQAVDQAALSLGMAMGPLAMADLVGIDLTGRERVRAGVADPVKNVRDALYAAGRLGQKTSKGFYRYDAQRRATIDPEAEEIIAAVVKARGVAPKAIPSAEDIQQRLFFPLVNEGFKILEEGHAIRPSDIDVVYVHGYGFPRYLGGPMHWADAVGLDKVVQHLERQGVPPAALLVSCVRSGSTLAAAWAKRGTSKL